MPLYQFTNTDTNERTRRIVFQGEDVRTFLSAGTYTICRIEETLSPPATVEIPVVETEPPSEPVDPVEAPTAPEPDDSAEPSEPVDPPATPEPPATPDPVEPSPPSQELPVPEILFPEDGTIEIKAHDGVVTLTVTESGAYDGEYEVDTAELAAKDAINLKPAVISGDAIMGSTLTATPGLWVYDGANPAPMIMAEWRKDDTPIADATGSTYTLADDYEASITYGETLGNAYQISNAIKTEPMPIAVEVPAPTPAPKGFAAIPNGVVVFDLRTKDHLYADRIGGKKVSNNDQDVEQFEDLSGNDNHYARAPRYGCPTARDGYVEWSYTDRIEPASPLVELENGMELFIRIKTLDTTLIPLHVSGIAAWGIANPGNQTSPHMVEAAKQNIIYEVDGSPVTSKQNAVSAAWSETEDYVTLHMRGVDLSNITDVGTKLSILSDKFIGNVRGIALTKALTATERAKTYAILAGD
ncbi:hypothetical protein [uncultured Jannaschia sp.]|uniref:hypothetical protein n=1 Tax=uncultured Jannaschia sp. TaxID=293347 RepID=UPI0026224D55|nr:hypothetical protein [uncultured Jannaschia sp.]